MPESTFLLHQIKRQCLNRFICSNVYLPCTLMDCLLKDNFLWISTCSHPHYPVTHFIETACIAHYEIFIDFDSIGHPSETQHEWMHLSPFLTLTLFLSPGHVGLITISSIHPTFLRRTSASQFSIIPHLLRGIAFDVCIISHLIEE